MSQTYYAIPLKQTSTNFGVIKKVIWFDINDTNGTFVVNLFVTPNQDSDINVVIFNKSSKEEMFSKKYNKSSDSTTITDSVSLTHVVGSRSATYGIKSL